MGGVGSRLRHGSSNEEEQVCTGYISLIVGKAEKGGYSPCGCLIVPSKHVWRIIGKLSIQGLLFDWDSR